MGTPNNARTSRLYRLGSRPVCGMPCGTSATVRRAAASRLVAVTPKRRAVRAALRLAALLPDRFSLGAVGPLEQLHGLHGIEAVLESVGPPGRLWPAVFWPPQPHRTRAYVHLLDDHGQPGGFLKLAQPGDAEALFRERDSLTAWDGGRGIVRTPKVVSSGTEPSSGASWLLVEPLPSTVRPVDEVPVEALLDVINGGARHVPEEELPSLSWWPALQRRLPEAPVGFRDALSRAVPSGVSVAPVHGDLAAHNMVQDGDRIWVYDWEDAAPDGPERTDRFGIGLFGRQPRDVLRDARALPAPELESFVWASAYGWANQAGRWPGIVSQWDESRGSTS